MYFLSHFKHFSSKYHNSVYIYHIKFNSIIKYKSVRIMLPDKIKIDLELSGMPVSCG